MTTTTPLTVLTVLTQAHDSLLAAVRGVPSGGWSPSTPCERWSVAQVLQHAAGDQLGFAGILTGGPMPADDPFNPSGTIDGDPLALVSSATAAAARAFAAVDPQAAEVPVPVPPNVLPFGLAIAACALDAAVHAWDIAVATGQPAPLTDEQADALRPVAEAIVEPLRAYGAYAAALPQPADRPAGADALLRFLGRDPAWRPPVA
jgi:uncharacterized protein (TIGR03086 family)